MFVVFVVLSGSVCGQHLAGAAGAGTDGAGVRRRLLEECPRLIIPIEECPC